MDSNKERAAEPAEAHVLLSAEESDIKHCNLKELILSEELMLTGVGEVLNEFGTTPGDSERDEYQRIEVSGIALWMLGKVVTQTRDEILRKLGIADERYQTAGVREFLEARNKPGRKETSKPAGS